MKIVFRHWDFLLSALIAIDVFLYLPPQVPTGVVKEIYSGGIAVLAIVFSVVFASLSLLSSVGDNDFIQFLEEKDNAMSTLLRSFSYTLNVIFSALVVSLAVFSFSAYRAAFHIAKDPSFLFCCFLFFLLYALLSSRLVAKDVIKFAEVRAKFIAERQKNAALE